MRAMAAGQAEHGITPGSQSLSRRATWTPEERLADMDALGVDVHVVSTGAGFSYDDMDAQTMATIHRECNDEVHQRTLSSPDPFKGFAQVPMQDVRAAIDVRGIVRGNLPLFPCQTGGRRGMWSR
jgi:predicted TIM-barrel fold metal-dependent hydrolase